ncbi:MULTISPECIES: HNH endonuclease [Pontibacillus]|uniref:HNH endonuclease n=1 Tax=Pontibacillus chungwhensis TaxID=265426 RepID=A0ABY8UX66_9BACI|nr:MULTISPECIES: HNH endonuclease [Pontibacillus]MCD5324158.1 HNH endonuclease [Pontibacillus sp. HN14]WIF97783.1 HNH endonuclease [Pontibacillus chungwhensis]
MGLFRKAGKGIGTIGGGVVGGATKIAGKAVGKKWSRTGEWIEDVGDQVQVSTKTALDNAGQFVDGAVQSTYGLVKKDEYYKQQGFYDLKDSSGRTIKGVGSALKYTVVNVGETYKGIRSGDWVQSAEGLKNVGKVVAVSSLAIGVVDIVDGPDAVIADELDTRNDGLMGTEHPETGVPFAQHEIELSNGEIVEGTFPVFESEFSAMINEDLYLASDDVHFTVANDTLLQGLQESPGLANQLNLDQLDLQALAQGETPEGYTWHHHEQPGVLQLVDEEVHEQTGHTGGRSIWGGGSEYR